MTTKLTFLDAPELAHGIAEELMWELTPEMMLTAVPKLSPGIVAELATEVLQSLLQAAFAELTPERLERMMVRLLGGEIVLPEHVAAEWAETGLDIKREASVETERDGGRRLARLVLRDVPEFLPNLATSLACDLIRSTLK